MFRLVLRSRLQRTTGFCRRSFHSSTRYNNTAAVEAQIAIHEQFPHWWQEPFIQLHEYTGLPWLVAIPLTTVLIRSLVTPFRYRFALDRRDRRLAIPHLQMATTIIRHQAMARLEASVGKPQDIQAWQTEQWEAKRTQIEKRFPRAKPTALASTVSNSDITNLGGWCVVCYNTFAVWSLDLYPGMIGPEEFGNWSLPLTGVFFILAVQNANYFNGENLFRRSFWKSPSFNKDDTSSINPLRWNKQQQVGLVTGILPLSAAFCLIQLPSVVLLSALSNSIYTTMERVLIDRIAGVSLKVKNEPKAAIQTTRRPRAKTRP